MGMPESLLRAQLADLDLRVVSGAWPADMHGEMFISAPVIDDRLSYQLFGFGAMVRLSLEPGTYGAQPDRFALRHRVIDTPVRRLHDRLPDSFTGGLLGLESAFGHANMVNTAPLPWNGRLFATWDVGRPAEIDPVSLRFLGEMGSAASWGGDSFGHRTPLPQVFSTAHPIVDPERQCLWTIKLGLASAGLEAGVVRYDGSGTRVRTWRLPGAVVVGSMHTIAQTQHWLVLADSGNFKADMNEIMGGERTVLVDTTVPVYFIRKDDLDATPEGEAVPYQRATFGPTTGHYYASWDDSDGVHVLFEHMDLTDLGYRLRPGDVDAHGAAINPAHIGFYQMAMSSQTVSEVVFRPGQAEHGERLAMHRDDWTWNLQLSAMDWSLEGQRAPTHHHVVFQGRRPGMLARRVLDVYRDRVGADVAGAEQPASLATFRRGGLAVHARHEFALDDLPSSPIFVPRRGGVPGGGDGWVVMPVLNDDGARIELFDAGDVGRGPIAVLAAEHGQQLPFMLHSVWMPAATPAPDVERLRFGDDIDESHLSRLSDDQRDAVLAVAADLT